MQTPQELIADLACAFPREKVQPATLRLYLSELADIPDMLLAATVRDLIRTSEFFPTIRAVRETAAERMLGLPGEAEALAQIERVASTHAGVNEVHPFVFDTLKQVGGFYAFRTSDEPGVVRGQFLRLYKDARGRAVREAQVGDMQAIERKQGELVASGS